MIADIISRLMNGEHQVCDQFARAKTFWDAFYEDHSTDSVQDLSECLFTAQRRFYNQVAPDNYPFAKALMPLTAIAALYDDATGFEENVELAQRIVRAFRASMVSVEVKGAYLRSTLKIYGLEVPDLEAA